MAIDTTLQRALLRLAADGSPTHLVWDARAYRVTDAPTRLEDALGALLTHPLPVVGWRFQGTALDDGDARVFDVVRCDDAWRVVKTYR